MIKRVCDRCGGTMPKETKEFIEIKASDYLYRFFTNVQVNTLDWKMPYDPIGQPLSPRDWKNIDLCLSCEKFLLSKGEST